MSVKGREAFVAFGPTRDDGKIDLLDTAHTRDADSQLPLSETSRPRLWLLAGAHKGDNEQLVTLAEAMGFSYRIDSDYQGIASILADRVAGGRFTLRRYGAGARAEADWPDLVVISGGRRVGDALRIKRASGGRTKIVCIGRPWAGLELFDLVITTAQYCLPRRSNVLQNTLTLNAPEEAKLNRAAARWADRFADLPRPRITVLVGGNSGSYYFDTASARRLAEEAQALAERQRGSLLVITSPRTPPKSVAVIEQALSCPHVMHTWRAGEADNPYLAYLAVADRFVVTGDSASILSQACASGKPVRLFELPQRLVSRILTTLQRPLMPLLAGPTGAGLWVPARDMRRFHKGLRRRGLLEEDLATSEIWRTAVPDDMARTVRRIERLLSEDPAIRRSTGQGAESGTGNWGQPAAVAGKPAQST